MLPETILPTAPPRCALYCLLRCPLLAALACCAGIAAGQDAPAKVTVTATRDPVDKSYRKMIAGMDRFERSRALAPQAALRFQLLPRLPTTRLDGISLRVVGDTVALPVTVAPDHTFTLDRNSQALREDAALIASSKTSTLTWRAQVRSPRVPPGMRRLGDLRLECKVLVATAKEELGFWLTSMINTLLLTTDWCSHEKIQLSTTAERRIATATLLHGEQRVPLKLNSESTSYTPPLGNKTYPDDALIDVRYADEPAA